MRNGSLWSNVVFEKEVISHWNIWIEFETSAEVSKSSIWKHTTCAARVFCQPLISCNFANQLSPNFHRFVILCIHVEIFQVRRLIFDNYQRCPVPLNTPGLIVIKKDAKHNKIMLTRLRLPANLHGRLVTGVLLKQLYESQPKCF